MTMDLLTGGAFPQGRRNHEEHTPHRKKPEALQNADPRLRGDGVCCVALQTETLNPSASSGQAQCTHLCHGEIVEP